MRVTDVVIEPVRKTRRLPLEADAAFGLFTFEMGRWWPLASHSIAGDADAQVRFEGAVGGRVVEIPSDGTEHSWADVLAWDRPHRVVLSWHPNADPVAASTLEVRFETAPGGSVMQLEHRGWEEFGADRGAELRADYEPGWDMVLAPYEALAAER